MASNYQRQYDKDYGKLLTKHEELLEKYDDLNIHFNDLKKLYEKNQKQLEIMTSQIKALAEENKNKDDLILSLNATIEQLVKVVDKLQQQINKDSNNSNKPSGSNGYKKVITNRREKSDKKKGGQVAHEGHVLKIKQVKKMIDSGAFEHKIIEENKTKDSTKYVSRYEIDLEIKLVIKEFRDYSCQKNLNPVTYGQNIKSISALLQFDNYISTDGVVKFISNISNGKINLSKGTIVNWTNELSKNATTDLEIIKAKLMKSYYTNNDDSQIKIDGERYNQIVCSNKDYTYLAINKHKSAEAIAEIGILPGFNGITIKDGASLYSNYGSKASQCLSHILRYLKGVYELNNRPEAKTLMDYLGSINKERDQLIHNNITEFNDCRIKEIYEEYDKLLDNWQKALNEEMQSNKSKYYDNEINLLDRMKGKHKEEILYFIKDFKVPSTNNQAEVDQRGLKVKQRIGKFRSEGGANNYANIRSIILTLKKQKANVFDKIKLLVSGKPTLI